VSGENHPVNVHQPPPRQTDQITVLLHLASHGKNYEQVAAELTAKRRIAAGTY